MDEIEKKQFESKLYEILSDIGKSYNNFILSKGEDEKIKLLTRLRNYKIHSKEILDEHKIEFPELNEKFRNYKNATSINLKNMKNSY